jgi:hypothetical protein
MNRHTAAPAERDMESSLGGVVLHVSDDPYPDDPGASPCADAFRVGGVCVQLEGARHDDVTLVPSLVPFRVENWVPDITIQVQWVAELSPASGPRLFDSGSVWRLHEDEAGFRFDFSAPVLGARPYKKLVVDRHFSQATLQMSEGAFAGFPRAAEPLEYPLDELLIMHRLTQEKAIELHGVGIVGPEGASNLFVGHSGAGKSTTARLWTTLHEVEILSDDRIIIREDKVREDEAREDANRIFMYGTPWHGEAAFALPGRAPLQRIFVLEHGRGNVLTRLSQGQAVAELFARSFVPFHRHEYVDSALAFLHRVAGSVPCYRYSFEPDERAVEKVLNFRD